MKHTYVNHDVILNMVNKIMDYYSLHQHREGYSIDYLLVLSRALLYDLWPGDIEYLMMHNPYGEFMDESSVTYDSLIKIATRICSIIDEGGELYGEE